MKKMVLFLFALIISGCVSTRDFNDEPRFDVNGKKVAGDDLYMEEYLRWQVIQATIKSLDDTVSNFPSALNPPSGWLKGYLVNKSWGGRKNFNVVIYTNSNKETKYFSGNISSNSYMEIYLPPGIGYYAEFDGGRGCHLFDVLATQSAVIQLDKNTLSGYFYLYTQ